MAKFRHRQGDRQVGFPRPFSKGRDESYEEEQVNIIIHRNDREGVQLELDGVLITICSNKAHGISGSIAVLKDSGMDILDFHGKHPEQVFPLEVHGPERVRRKS